MHEIVKYKNVLNELPLRNFNPIDLNFLMVICSIARDKNTDELEISFQKMKELSHYESVDKERFMEDIKGFYKKLLDLTCCLVFPNGDVEGFNLFHKYKIFAEEEVIKFEIDKEYAFILNELSDNFTRFELEEFASLSSSYSKECYRRLKQYRTVGVWNPSIEEFRQLLCVPECYKIGHLDQKVLYYIKKELPKYFKNLKIEKIKHKRAVTRIKFTFKKEIIPKIKVADLPPKKPKKQQYTNKFLNFEPSDTDYEALLQDKIYKTR